MSEQHPKGGYAFARGSEYHGGDAGMTLRDWFAGQALAGIAGLSPDDGFSLSPADSAAWAYEYADAMLKEREK